MVSDQIPGDSRADSDHGTRGAPRGLRFIATSSFNLSAGDGQVDDGHDRVVAHLGFE